MAKSKLNLLCVNRTMRETNIYTYPDYAGRSYLLAEVTTAFKPSHPSIVHVQNNTAERLDPDLVALTRKHE